MHNIETKLQKYYPKGNKYFRDGVYRMEPCHVVKEITPKFIKNKINKRNRLLKCFKRHPSIELKTKISNLNFEIRTNFFTKKQFNVRKGILPNNSKSLWHAVKFAKNVSESKIPSNMSLNNFPVSSDEISDRFAEFFERKVLDIVSSTKVNQNVHNGSRKIYATDSMFMARVNIKACINAIVPLNIKAFH